MSPHVVMSLDISDWIAKGSWESESYDLIWHVSSPNLDRDKSIG